MAKHAKSTSSPELNPRRESEPLPQGKGRHAAPGSTGARHAGHGTANTSQRRYRQNPHQQAYGYAAQRGASYGDYASPRGTFDMPNVPLKKAHRGRRAAIIILSILLALVLGAGAALALYMGKLDQVLAGAQSNSSSLDAALTDRQGNDAYYVLVLGSDSREGSGTGNNESEEGDQHRSDVMLLVRVDPTNKQVTMVSIPRDTYWAHDGTVNKINEAYNIGGAAMSVQVVEDLTGVKISHCVEVDFSGLGDIVDYLGGIEVNVPQDISYEDALTGETVSVSAGKQTLTGQQAQIFARVRKAYSNQDEQRQSNVRQLVEAVANKVLDRPITEIPGVILQLASYVGTDIRSSDLVNMGLSFAGGGVKFYSCTGPDVGYNDETLDGAYLVYPSPEGWARLMAVVDSGGDPSSVDPNEEINAQLAAEAAAASQTAAETEADAA